MGGKNAVAGSHWLAISIFFNVFNRQKSNVEGRRRGRRGGETDGQNKNDIFKGEKNGYKNKLAIVTAWIDGCLFILDVSVFITF